MIWLRAKRSLVTWGCVAILVGCTSAQPPSGGPTSSGASGGIVTELPDNPSKPYVITAINYHFHDAHPTLPLAPGRTVKWTNQGSVVHNVSFPQIGYSKDFAVGETIAIPALGKKLGGPGTYQFFCRFHQNLGMIGTVVIAAPH